MHLIISGIASSLQNGNRYSVKFLIPPVLQHGFVNNLRSKITTISNDTLLGLIMVVASVALHYLKITCTTLTFLTTFAACILAAKVVIYSPDSYNDTLSKANKQYWLEFAYTHIGNRWGFAAKTASVALLALVTPGTLGLGLSAGLGLYQGAVSDYMDNRASQEKSRKTTSSNSIGHKSSRPYI